MSYGLGSDSENLPAFVVMTSSDRGKTCGQLFFDYYWGSGFLPSRYQGVRFRNGPGFAQVNTRVVGSRRWQPPKLMQRLHSLAAVSGRIRERVTTNQNRGAIEGTRTPTPLRVHGPEPCASANSATSASDYSAVRPGRLEGRYCGIYSYKAWTECQTGPRPLTGERGQRTSSTRGIDDV